MEGRLKPNFYYVKDSSGSIVLSTTSVPTFTPQELAPTYHSQGVLGCPHYQRGCKLRHPASGKLYTCRLCCDVDNQTPNGKDLDLPLDRYAVTEVLCMGCGALQPAGEGGCRNKECGIKWAKYWCKICNLYDDEGGKVRERGDWEGYKGGGGRVGERKGKGKGEGRTVMGIYKQHTHTHTHNTHTHAHTHAHTLQPLTPTPIPTPPPEHLPLPVLQRMQVRHPSGYRLPSLHEVQRLRVHKGQQARDP